MAKYEGTGLLTEKILYIYGHYLDEVAVSMKNEREHRRNNRNKTGNLHSSQTKAIEYYLKSVQKGHKYLWQTLPRALELWFEVYGINKNDDQRLESMILRLETYKIAQVLDFLLSRFGHNKAGEVVFKLVGKVAKEYPLQSTWWLFHFKYFYPNTRDSPNIAVQSDKKKRQNFSNKITKKILEEEKDIGDQNDY